MPCHTMYVWNSIILYNFRYINRLEYIIIMIIIVVVGVNKTDWLNEIELIT